MNLLWVQKPDLFVVFWFSWDFLLVSVTFHSAVSHGLGYLLIATDSMCWYAEMDNGSSRKVDFLGDHLSSENVR